jgi:type IV pilus assembly protein PilM
MCFHRWKGISGMFFGGNSVVALDIGTSSIKLAEVEMNRRGPTLKRFSVVRLAPGLVSGGEIVDTVTVGQNIEALLKSAKSAKKNIATGMWGSSVIVKKISMPKMEEKLVAEQIKWEAEQYIPFDINEVSLEHHILRNRGGSAESMEVLLIAAKQELLFRLIESIEASGAKCVIVDVAGFALANCFEASYGVQQGTVGILNIGAGVTNFVVIDRGEVVFCRDVPVGGQVYTTEIQKAMGVSPQEAEALKLSASLGQEVPQDVNNILSATNDQVVDEIRNSFEFYGATSGGVGSISRIYVSGGSMYVPGLVEQISRAVSVPYEFFDPFTKLAYDAKSLPADFIAQIKAICPVAIGLAMRKVGD